MEAGTLQRSAVSPTASDSNGAKEMVEASNSVGGVFSLEREEWKLVWGRSASRNEAWRSVKIENQTDPWDGEPRGSPVRAS